MTAAITSEDEIEVEEAYFRTLALPAGFTLKGGRFFSGVGYLNEIHAHAWDFVDQPLVYQAFFGGQLAQDGLQLKWLAPTDLFLELGAETGNGDAFPGTRRTRNGLNGTTLFAHVGSDVGDSASWRAGVSWLDLRRRGPRATRTSTRSATPVENAFTGTRDTWIADATSQVGAARRPARRCAQAAGRVHAAHRGRRPRIRHRRAPSLADGYRSTQSGWYVQSVYQFLPRWRVGLRYDALDSGTPHIGLVESGDADCRGFPAAARRSTRAAPR